MTPKEIIKDVVEKKELKQGDIANRLGVDKRIVSMRLHQKSITTDKLNEMLRVLDYRLVIMPTTEKLPKDSYEL